MKKDSVQGWPTGGPWAACGSQGVNLQPPDSWSRCHSLSAAAGLWAYVPSFCCFCLCPAPGGGGRVVWSEGVNSQLTRGTQESCAVWHDTVYKHSTARGCPLHGMMSGEWGTYGVVCMAWGYQHGAEGAPATKCGVQPMWHVARGACGLYYVWPGDVQPQPLATRKLDSPDLVYYTQIWELTVELYSIPKLSHLFISLEVTGHNCPYWQVSGPQYGEGYIVSSKQWRPLAGNYLVYRRRIVFAFAGCDRRDMSLSNGEFYLVSCIEH